MYETIDARRESRNSRGSRGVAVGNAERCKIGENLNLNMVRREG
jgi:hypothetical protein